MKLIVGLGNPGPEYAGTRHNIGFRVVEHLGDACGIALDSFRFDAFFGSGELRGQPISLLEPQTFMNRSGGPTLLAVDALGIEVERDLLVVFDDLDLPFGRLRVRASGGAGGHNGLGHILSVLENERIARLRFGIGRPPPQSDSVDYVLSPFDDAEEAALSAHVSRAADAVATFVAEGAALAMNRFNAEPAEREA